jgi:hypothetical protein
LWPRCCWATIIRVKPESVIYRAEVLAIIGALADLVVEVREIRRYLLEDDDDEEEDAEGS